MKKSHPAKITALHGTALSLTGSVVSVGAFVANPTSAGSWLAATFGINVAPWVITAIVTAGWAAAIVAAFLGFGLLIPLLAQIFRIYATLGAAGVAAW